MNHVTAKIALIAYLMGGWLLPATHHHGHSCNHASHVECDSGSGHHHHSADVRSADHSHGSCSHDHDDTHSHPSPSQPTVQSLVVYSDEGWDCDGLCALCVARTQSTIESACFQGVAVADVTVDTCALLDFAAVLPALASGHSPRGPPQNLV